jgi:hypothetical protein
VVALVIGEGEDEKEEHECDDHEVHVDAEDHAAVIEAPAALDAADGFNGAGETYESGEDEEERGLEARRMRYEYRYDEAAEDENVGASERVSAEIQNGSGVTRFYGVFQGETHKGPGRFRGGKLLRSKSTADAGKLQGVAVEVREPG